MEALSVEGVWADAGGANATTARRATADGKRIDLTEYGR